jgi:hypothetical protein
MRDEIDIDKGEGDTPAMNIKGRKAKADRSSPAPGHRGWDAPMEEAPESLEAAVRAAPPEASDQT